jgi:NADH-quinone oxidoreductase subunit G
MVELTIDGRTVSVPKGTNVLEAAKTIGLRIPNFCYHPDLSWEGSCRMCLVAIEGRPKLLPSCCEPVAAGMKVRVADPVAEDARRAQLEFLLINHPLDCPICDQAGECKLQDYYVEHGRYTSRMPRDLKTHKKKVVDLGERIVLDKERCVLCSRCVRFCREVSDSHALQFFTRGVTTEIGTENDQPITGDNYIGNVVDICPVGALTSKDFRFQQRVWFLRSVESVCGNCSTGCNIRADHKEGVLYRFVPRRNPEVNKSWICDAGRDSYKSLQGATRLRAPLVRRGERLEPATWDDALAQVDLAIGAARTGNRVAALASPRASTETLFVFKRFVNAVLGTPRVDYRVDGSHTRTAELRDHLLYRADPHPNNTACRLLDLGRADGAEAILAACERGDISLLYLLGTELLERHPDPERVRRSLAHVDQVVVHALHETPALGLATVVLPDAAHTEMEGTFVNYAERVQRFRRAFPPPGMARPAAVVLADLAARRGETVPRGKAEELFALIGRDEPAFAGLDYARLGNFGAVAAAAQPAGAA